MPADPDLDALDALLKAATRHTKLPLQVVTQGVCDANGMAVAGYLSTRGDYGDEEDNMKLHAAAVNALPVLLRRARIGDAAREVLADLLLRGLDHDNYVLVHRHDWQRARALLETKDA